MQRELQHKINGQAAMDGDGVRMTRIIGSAALDMLDPFLLLDHFESDQAEDYIGGFPDHPHRGFETVTYLLAGRMRHRDNAGHEGVIEAGGVQWMTAGRGIVHSEMPEQEDGLLSGFQLWVNLPASEKMCEPGYQEFPREKIAIERQDNETEIRVVAGRTNAGTTGPVRNEHVNPLYFDVSLGEGANFQQAIPEEHNTFIYVIEGSLLVGDRADVLETHQLGILGKGNALSLKSLSGCRFLLVSAQPLNEAVARGGPFVMNTREEVMQAFQDYQSGQF